MTPYITLKIEDHTPHLYLSGREDEFKKLTFKDEKIIDNVIKIAQKLQLSNSELEKEDNFGEILNLASEGDSQVLELPEINLEDLEFNLDQSLNEILDDALKIESEYEEIEMNEEVKKELERNRKIDILSGLVEQLYSIIIAKTLLAAYELEITEIKLNNAHNYARFTEKMGNELQKLGLEFTIL